MTSGRQGNGRDLTRSGDDIDRLIEKSSLGAEGARMLSERAPEMDLPQPAAERAGDTSFEPALGTRDRFFHHAPSVQTTGQPMRNDTRYLSAAMYLDGRLSRRVIEEYVNDEHRTVAPSYGFDLEPVVLHALRARRLRLFRDVALAAVWIVGWATVPLVTALFLLLALPLSALYLVPWRRLSQRWRLAAGVLFSCTAVPLLYGLFAGLRPDSGGTFDRPTGSAGGLSGLDAAQTDHPAITLLLLVLCFATVVVTHRALVFRVLARGLGPGAAKPPPGSSSQRVEQLLTRIGSAQRGNVTLYSEENPFIGAGVPRRAWSIALDLDRSASEAGHRPSRPDPVVMHRRVRDRLLEMRAEWPSQEPGDPLPGLPPNDGIAGLATDFHVLGRGMCAQYPRAVSPQAGPLWAGHPLIDAAVRVPFSVAAPETVDAIIRHPEGSLRCYQRATIGFQGQAIVGRGGQAIAPAEERDTALSAFVHLAVEGRMLYAEFVATVLPPIRREFRIVDVLPSWSTPTLLWKSVAAAWRDVVSSTMLSGFRVVQTSWEVARANIAAPDPAADMVHDYGARISVREIAADSAFHTFIQELDADKYTRLIERRVNDAILDYLQNECGVDTSTYRDQANVILNQGVIVNSAPARAVGSTAPY